MNNKEKIIIPTGSTCLDLALGPGGLPVGIMVNIIGDFSTGKSILATEIIANAIAKYGDRIVFKYRDNEAGYSYNSKKMYGIDIINNEEPPSTVEETKHDLTRQLNNLPEDKILLYITDSWDALTSKQELNRNKESFSAYENGKLYDKGTYGMEKQKAASEFFRLKAREIKNKNCLFIILSQIRDKPNVTFGLKERRAGGKALDLYASVFIWLKEIEKTKVKIKTETGAEKTKEVGIVTKATMRKNKLGKPRREAFINIIFDYGIDDITGCIEFLYDLRDKKGSLKKPKLLWDDKEYKIDKLIEYIEDNNLERKLRMKVKRKFRDEEKLADITKNRKNRWK